jgi:Na+/H+ antiporter NhaD/arsenite permease-like protein
VTGVTPLQPILGLDPAWVSGTILVIAYAVIMTEKLNRAVVAGVGACLMVLVGVLTQDEAIAGIDLNTIGLLTGMMLIVGVTKKTGLFQYIAIRCAQVTGGSPAATLGLLALATAVFSALLDNVTTVLLVVPVTLAVTKQLEVPPFPFLFAQVFASNLGGTSTLIGDPPNILIGSAADLTFNDFVLNTGIPVVIAIGVTGLIGHFVWARRMSATQAVRERVLALNARESITDPRLLKGAMGVLLLTITAFVLARALGLEGGTIAMSGAALLILFDNWRHDAEVQTQRVHAVLGELEWITLFFFIGLFVMVAGVERAGVLDRVADLLVRTTHGDPVKLMFAILWGSALLSAVLDNIPFVATMIPVIQALAPDLGGTAALLPLWWALSLGACMGGNGTLIGASANITVAGLAERAGTPFGFKRYTLPAFPLMLVTLIICHIYLAWRFGR